jgi:hypothetical protein
MRKYFLIGLAIALSNLINAQKPVCQGDVGDKMCLVKNEDKYGIISKKGEYIVPAYFDEIQVHGQGFIVKQNGKYGVFDRKGKIAIPIEFQSITCAGDCDRDFLFEVSDIGLKSIYITKKMDILYGMYKVTPFLSMSQREISIREWFAYVQDVKSKGFEYNYGYLETLPDTNKVEAKLRPAYKSFLAATEDMENENNACEKVIFGYLMSHKLNVCYDASLYEKKIERMKDFPVTGLSYNQVKRYTEWLTTVYRNEVTADDNLAYEINFRLPAVDEWEKIAESGLNEKFKANKCMDSLNSEGCMLFDFKTSTKCKNYDDQIKNCFGEGSVFNNSYFPDNNGIFCLFGNVAEMTFENGLCKGGSYTHWAKQGAYHNTIEYEGAEPWLGFRVVAEFKTIQ